MLRYTRGASDWYVLQYFMEKCQSIIPTAFNILSDQNNFVVCYPTALIGSSGMTEWDVSGFSDIDFIEDLNDSLWSEYQLDLELMTATKTWELYILILYFLHQ